MGTTNLIRLSLRPILLALLVGQFIIQPANCTDFSRQYFNSRIEKDAFYALLAPAKLTNQKLTLFVYLHDMDSNCSEPFVSSSSQSIASAITAKYPNSVFIACHTGAATWGNLNSLVDINSNIVETLRKFTFDKIVLLGTSMGGSTALTYAATAPHLIKQRVAGVVAIEPAGDLKALFNKTALPRLQDSLSKALGGTPKQAPVIYRNFSFLRNLPTLDRQIRIFVVSAKQDDHVPNSLQKEIVSALNNRDIPCQLVELNSGHCIPEPSVYLDGIKFILEPSKNLETKPASKTKPVTPTTRQAIW
jgi:dienelactone hydrolase